VEDVESASTVELEATRVVDAVAEHCADLESARRFLSMLDETADAFEFRTFDDDHERKAAGLARKLSGTLDEHSSQLSELNAAGAGVFVVVNRGGQTAETIEGVRAVFADTDGAPLEPIVACGLEPHAVVESSPERWHVYWLVDGLPLDAFRAIQQSIAERFGTDTTVCDLPRVMRLPGFDHRKAGRHRVRVVHEGGGVPYCAAQLAAVFGEDATRVRREATPAQAQAPSRAVGTILPSQELEIRSALACLDPDPRETWLKVGMALHSTSAPNAYGLWTEWSQRSTKFRAEDQKKTWASLSHKPGGVHLETIFALAQRAGWVNTFAPAKTVVVDEAVANTQVGPSKLPMIAVAAGDLHGASIEAPRFVVATLIPRDHVTLLGGHGGLGKSTLALTLAAHIACGRPWAGFACDKGRAIYASLEDSADLCRFRLRHIVDAYELDRHAVSRNVVILDGSEADDTCVGADDSSGPHGRLRFEVSELGTQLRDAVKGASFIVVDSAVDAFSGNEINRGEVRRFVRFLSQLARQTKAGLVLLAHVDKASAKFGAAGNSYSGSSAWHNSARSRLALVDDGGSIELRHEKSNLGKRTKPIRLHVNEHGVLIPAIANSIADQSVDAALLHCLAAAIGRGDVIGTSRVGSATALACARTLPGFPEVLRAPRKFWDALGRLESAGRIVKEEYRTHDRKTRQRYAICANAPNAPNTA
jgi:hypothetical protein